MFGFFKKKKKVTEETIDKELGPAVFLKDKSSSLRIEFTDAAVIVLDIQKLAVNLCFQFGVHTQSETAPKASNLTINGPTQVNKNTDFTKLLSNSFNNEHLKITRPDHTKAVFQVGVNDEIQKHFDEHIKTI